MRLLPVFDKVTMTSEEVEEQVATIVQATVLKKVPRDTLLFETGLLDSVGAVGLMLALEDAFGVPMPMTEVDEHLRSPAAITEYVLARM